MLVQKIRVFLLDEDSGVEIREIGDQLREDREGGIGTGGDAEVDETLISGQTPYADLKPRVNLQYQRANHYDY
ncbi:MAG: hypothetical protein LQ340_004143 [Diploschistes diacapsis]|nr:MAG: hypothetical protein LQ340_004143 [Diploschistes diacapsis]